VNGVVESCVGAPTVYEELRHKPGRHLTLRASGPHGSAIVNLYLSNRVLTVAARIEALADGPSELEVPVVLAVDAAAHMLVLSDVPGAPLRDAVLASDEGGCHRAGRALGAWHGAWRERVPRVFRAHTIGDELDRLADQASLAPGKIQRRVAEVLPELGDAWGPTTVVHRDLYEEQVLIGERIGLIDVDDAAAGPPELDVGNLLAHLDLLGLRAGRKLANVEAALLAGYLEGGRLDLPLLDRCRVLARLRLACIHRERLLLEPLPPLCEARS
jgi:Ser/Thr protein kinase RdoA (MazF antagonist)